MDNQKGENNDNPFCLISNQRARNYRQANCFSSPIHTTVCRDDQLRPSSGSSHETRPTPINLRTGCALGQVSFLFVPKETASILMARLDPRGFGARAQSASCWRPPIKVSREDRGRRLSISWAESKHPQGLIGTSRRADCLIGHNEQLICGPLVEPVVLVVGHAFGLIKLHHLRETQCPAQAAPTAQAAKPQPLAANWVHSGCHSGWPRQPSARMETRRCET